MQAKQGSSAPPPKQTRAFPGLAAEADSLTWVPVRSSTIAALAYSPAFGRGFVRFRSGDRYAYHDMPKAVMDAWIVSGSKGRYLYYEVRAKGTDSRFAYDGPF